MKTVPKAMTIAGSDSGGGAGLQADLKTFASLGVYGTSVVTAITAQNTMRVTDVLELPCDLIAHQFEAVISDIGADAVKTGMLSSSAIIKVVADMVRQYGITNLVVDPVMIAKGGDRLLQKEAVRSLINDLMPLAKVITPNLPEAEVILKRNIKGLNDAKEAAQEIVAMGAKSVVVKGGHLDGDAIDTFYDGANFWEFSSPRIATSSTHGTGCTFASAIAAGLAKDMSLEAAVAQAKSYVTEAICHAFPLGQGHGPVNHFYKLSN